MKDSLNISRRAAILILLAVVLAACGGGGGGGGGVAIVHAPKLSALSLSPTSADQYDGNGTIQVNFYFEFQDAGGDIQSISTRVTDSNGIVLDAETIPVSGSGITYGYGSGYFDADTTVPGNYTIEFSVADLLGSRSNWVQEIFTIIPAASPVSIDVAPVDPAIPKGASQQFTATANYSDGTTLTVTNLCVWTSSNTAVATIDWTGLAYGQLGGTSIITADFKGASGSTTLAVTDILLLSLAVTPQNPSIDRGGTVQLAATGTYADNTTRNLTTLVTWTSSNPGVAIVSSAGAVTGVAGGSAVITAISGTFQDSSTVHVLADFGAAAKYPGTPSLYLGNSAIGDLNGDGRNDVAAIEANWGGMRIAMSYQNADHTLGAQQVIMTDLILRDVAITDVNDDGLAELIVAGNATSGSPPLGRVYVYTQDPSTHVLNAPQKCILSTSSVAGMAVADLNNDGLPDIVVSGAGSIGTAVVSFLFQGPSGSLASEVTYTAISVYDGGELHAADMNSDGLTDIVLQSDVLQLAVIKQVSAGQFSTFPDYFTVQTSYWPFYYSFALGDLNGDGRTDIGVADPGNGSYLNIFYQNNSGQLIGPTVQQISYAFQPEIHIADVNGDGLNDIIMITDGNDVEIMHQNADHTFSSITDYILPSGVTGGTSIHQAMSIGDVTGDGLPDIVTTWVEDVYVLPRLP